MNRTHPICDFIPSFFDNQLAFKPGTHSWERHTLFGRVISVLATQHASECVKPYAGIVIDDPNGCQRIFIETEIYTRLESIMKINNLLLIEANVMESDNSGFSLFLTDAFKIERPLPTIKPEHFHFQYIQYMVQKTQYELLIDDTVLRINQDREPDEQLVLDTVPLDDPDTYAYLKEVTDNPFKLIKPANHSLIKILQPKIFDELMICVCLSFPNMIEAGVTERYLQCMQGKSPHYLIPELQPLLQPTFGILIYREQIMNILETLAGYSTGEAKSFCRLFVSKKQPELSMFYHGFIQILSDVTMLQRSRELTHFCSKN